MFGDFKEARLEDSLFIYLGFKAEGAAGVGELLRFLGPAVNEPLLPCFLCSLVGGRFKIA